MNTFRVVLVYPNLQMVPILPSNIGILTACLKKAGFDVRLFDTTLYRIHEKSTDDIRVEYMQLRPFNLKDKGVDYKQTNVFEDFKKLIEDYKPNLIGVSATDDTIALGMSLVSYVSQLKLQRQIHVSVGGVFPTFSPDETINYDNVDSICIGEGEEAIVELCRRIQDGSNFTDIKNMWFKLDGKIYKNSLRQPVQLDDIPFEDFDLFEEKRFYRPMQGKIFKMLPVSIDRGCLFTCAFCAAPQQIQLYKDNNHANYFRVKSIGRIMDELRHNLTKYKADYLYFNSETFFAKTEEHISEFGKMYSREIGLPFWCQTRIETITERRVKLLEDMNCERMSIGLEHGNDEFRKKVLKKHFTNKQVLGAFKILEKGKIPVTVNNIIGFPDETRELAFDTIKLNRMITADSINALFFVPYSGTPLRKYCIEKGYISKDTKTNTLVRGSVLNMPQFPPQEIKGLVRTFPLYVKMPESYFEKIKVAEQFNEEGDKMHAELRDIYFRDYFK